MLRLLTFMFRLPWVVYFALAAAVGYLTYTEYQTYQFNLFEAQWRAEEATPDPTPLSKWNAATDVTGYGEVHVRGLYFDMLPQGTFDPIGLEQAFILLADDQGREVKAVLVVRPDDLVQLQRQLQAQGDGDRFLVTVNGAFNSNSDWAHSISTELFVLNVPSADELVVIEPYLGDRATHLRQKAEDGIGVVSMLGAIAGLLVIYGALRYLSTRGSSRRAKAKLAKNRSKVARQSKRPSTKAVPDNPTREASPWGTFQPQQRAGGAMSPPALPPSVPTPTQPMPAAPAQADMPRARQDKKAVPSAPDFKSAFPRGGSGFRFKTADQIIRQSFGTLSSLKRLNDDN